MAIMAYVDDIGVHEAISIMNAELRTVLDLISTPVRILATPAKFILRFCKSQGERALTIGLRCR
jgi:hypothetical protein